MGKTLRLAKLNDICFAKLKTVSLWQLNIWPKYIGYYSKEGKEKKKRNKISVCYGDLCITICLQNTKCLLQESRHL